MLATDHEVTLEIRMKREGDALISDLVAYDDEVRSSPSKAIGRRLFWKAVCTALGLPSRRKWRSGWASRGASAFRAFRRVSLPSRGGLASDG